MTYNAWVDCLSRFADGDDAALDEMSLLQVEWQPGVAERLTVRVAAAFQQRLSELQRRLQRDLDAGLGDVAGVGQSLTRARSRLLPLVRLSRLPNLPPQVQASLADELARIVGDMDEALEHSVDRRSQVGIELLAQIRQNRLSVALATDVQDRASEAATPAAGPSRRAIIL